MADVSVSAFVTKVSNANAYFIVQSAEWRNVYEILKQDYL